MSVLFFSGETKGPSEHIQRIIEAQVPGDEIEIHRNIKSLTSRLRGPRCNLTIIVLLAVSCKDLQGLLLIRDLFDDIPIILILPDRERDTITAGHKLYPRFLSYMDSDFSDVALVLTKMLERAERTSASFWARAANRASDGMESLEEV